MRILCAILMLGFLIDFGNVATASVISISPTRLYISSDNKATAFKLKNNGDEKALVEVKVYAWTDGDNRQALESTEDFLVAPPVFEIGPDEGQTLRIVPRVGPELTRERMYRLVVTEIASEIGPSNGVGFSVEMSLPIFLAPDGAVPEPKWSLDLKDSDSPELIVVNEGDAHTRVRHVELFDAAEGEPIFETSKAAYVFPGEQKGWSLKGDFSGLRGPIKLKAETTKGLIEALIPLPES